MLSTRHIKRIDRIDRTQIFYPAPFQIAAAERYRIARLYYKFSLDLPRHLSCLRDGPLSERLPSLPRPAAVDQSLPRYGVAPAPVHALDGQALLAVLVDGGI